MTIGLFLHTGLVTQRCFYTFISLICLGGVSIASILPTALIRRPWYYGVCFFWN